MPIANEEPIQEQEQAEDAKCLEEIEPQPRDTKRGDEEGDEEEINEAPIDA